MGTEIEIVDLKLWYLQLIKTLPIRSHKINSN